MLDALRPRIDQTVEHLASRWQSPDRHLLPKAFPLLLGGGVEIETLAGHAGVPRSRIDDAVSQARAERDAAGRIVELYGIMLQPTFQRIKVGERHLFACCALVAQMSPLLLGATVEVESVDPLSRRLVRLAIGPRGIEAVEPSAAVATMIVTSAHLVREDVTMAFCRHVRHFVSEQSAEEWLSQDPARYLVDIQTMQDTATRLYQRVWAPDGGHLSERQSST